MNEQQLIKLLESAEGTIARLMLEVNRLSKEVDLRELTDEEIEGIAIQHLTVHVQFIGAGDCTIEGEIEFARAILQKAREK